MASRRYISIQGLRGVAALCVVFHHAVLLGGIDAPSAFPPPVLALADFGSCGVDLFFVISGFVMANSIGDGDRRPRPDTFLLRRAARVFPLFWLLSAVVIAQALTTGHSYPAASYLNTLTLIPIFDRQAYDYPSLFVAWSLGYEMVFYAMVAAVLWRAPRRAVGLLLAMIATAAAIGLRIGYISPLAAFVANPILGEFGLGVLAWIVSRRAILPSTGRLLAGLGAALLASGLFIDVGQGFSVDPTLIVTGISSLQRTLVWGLPCAMIVCGAAAADTSNRTPLTRLGDASYSLYLAHPIVIGWLAHFAWSPHPTTPYLAVTGSCALSIAVAFAIHAAIERPLMVRTSPTIASLRKAVAHGRWNGSARPGLALD